MNQSRPQPEDVGQGEHVYQPMDAWHQVPADMSMGEAVGIAVDSQDQVFVFNRGQHPVMVFDADGKYVRCWGEGEFRRPHGIHIDSDDVLYLTDDQGHCIYKRTADGERRPCVEPVVRGRRFGGCRRKGAYLHVLGCAHLVLVDALTSKLEDIERLLRHLLRRRALPVLVQFFRFFAQGGDDLSMPIS